MPCSAFYGIEQLTRPIAAILAAGSLCVTGLGMRVVHAQVTPDGTLGTAVTTNVNTFEIRGGTRAGTNLFHSFGSFSVGTGEVANFINGPTALPTSNILSRVTGGSFSDINGTIQTTGFGAASLFLINPAGIVFGPGAFLDVGGSFHATTAHYVKLGTDGAFYADPTHPGNLLTASPPSAFGFLNGNTGFIETLGPALVVPEGATLSLVGGEVHIADTWLIAPGGTVNLVSAASAGEVTVNNPINVSGFSALGPINIVDGSIVDGKNIFIRGGQLVISDALVFPGGFSNQFDFVPPPDGGEVNIVVTGDVRISGTGPVPFLNDTPGIQTFAGSSTDFVSGNVPHINIKAANLTVSGEAVILSIRQGPENPDAPRSPSISITADQMVKVEGGASIGLLNSFEGPGGTLTINASDVLLSGNGAPGFTGLVAQGQFHPLFVEFSDPELTYADAGSININARNSVKVNDAEISATSFAFGSGGNITINTGDLSLANNAALFAESTLAGSAGNVTLDATGTVDVTGGSIVSVLTSGGGSGGTLTVRAGKAVNVSESSSLFSSTAPPSEQVLNNFAKFFLGPDGDWLGLVEVLEVPNDLFAVLTELNAFGLIALAPDQLTAGNAGKVFVATPQLNLSAGGVLSSSTGWDGNAGQIEAQVGSLTVTGGAEIRSRSGLVENGIVLLGTGDAGKVTINATGPNTISITNNGSISTTTLGAGDGGDIELTSAGRVLIASGGSVTADSLGGTGLTGNITITAATDIVMDGGSISTRAQTSDGGNIKLTAPNIVYLEGSQITTSVESGVGGGGNITIDPQFVIVNNSSIIANAFGGPGGNITIIANEFLQSATSVIEASSALSTPGVIEVRSPENNVENNIAQLPGSFIDASALLRGLCTARRTGAPSSFVVAGRGGLPVDADGYLPSLSAEVAAGVASATGSTHADAVRITQPFLTAGLLFPNELHCLR